MTTFQTISARPVRKRQPEKVSNSEVDKHNRKKEFLEQFAALGRRLEEYRKDNGLPEDPFTMEEIVAMVKEVRAEQYAKQHKC